MTSFSIRAIQDYTVQCLMSREFPNALIGSALPAHLYAAVAVPRKLIRMSFRHRMACGHGALFLEPWPCGFKVG